MPDTALDSVLGSISDSASAVGAAGAGAVGAGARTGSAGRCLSTAPSSNAMASAAGHSRAGLPGERRGSTTRATVWESRTRTVNSPPGIRPYRSLPGARWQDRPASIPPAQPVREAGTGLDPGRRQRTETDRRRQRTETDRKRRALAAWRRRARGAQPRDSGSASRVRNATRRRRSVPRGRRVIRLQRSGIRLQRSGIRLQRSDIRLQRSDIRLQRSDIRLQRECPHRATAGACVASAVVAPHAALAAAAGRAVLAEAIARAAALHTVAAAVDGAATGSARRDLVRIGTWCVLKDALFSQVNVLSGYYKRLERIVDRKSVV